MCWYFYGIISYLSSKAILLCEHEIQLSPTPGCHWIVSHKTFARPFKYSFLVKNEVNTRFDISGNFKRPLDSMSVFMKWKLRLNLFRTTEICHSRLNMSEILEIMWSFVTLFQIDNNVMVTYFCHLLSDNYVHLSDLYVVRLVRSLFGLVISVCWLVTYMYSFVK